MCGCGTQFTLYFFCRITLPFIFYIASNIPTHMYVMVSFLLDQCQPVLLPVIIIACYTMVVKRLVFGGVEKHQNHNGRFRVLPSTNHQLATVIQFINCVSLPWCIHIDFSCFLPTSLFDQSNVGGAHTLTTNTNTIKNWLNATHSYPFFIPCTHTHHHHV